MFYPRESLIDVHTRIKSSQQLPSQASKHASGMRQWRSRITMETYQKSQSANEFCERAAAASNSMNTFHHSNKEGRIFAPQGLNMPFVDNWSPNHCCGQEMPPETMTKNKRGHQEKLLKYEFKIASRFGSRWTETAFSLSSSIYFYKL